MGKTTITEECSVNSFSDSRSTDEDTATLISANGKQLTLKGFNLTDVLRHHVGHGLGRITVEISIPTLTDNEVKQIRVKEEIAKIRRELTGKQYDIEQLRSRLEKLEKEIQ